MSRYFRARRNSRRPPLFETLEQKALLTTIAWSEGPALPAPRTDAVAIVTLDDRVRLVGGNAAVATDAPVLNSGALSWSLGFSTDTPRGDLGAVSTGSAVFLFGGTGDDEGSDEVLNYDYRQGDSQDVAKMNHLRFDHGYAADALGRVYAFGGIGVRADGEIWADAERYEPATDTWSPIAPLPQPLRGMTAMGDGQGHIFVFGGTNTLTDTGIQNTTYRYDIATNSWSVAGPMPLGTHDSAVTMGADGQIYVTGGVTATGPTDAVQQYDPATNAWSEQTSLPSPVYSHASAYDTAGRIIVAGGFDATGQATSNVYVTQDLSIADVAPSITSAPVTSGSLDQPYTYHVRASGNPAPTYSLTTAPAGMTIDATTGLITWQPAAGQVGTHPVTIDVANRTGVVQQAFEISVVADTMAPTTPADFSVIDATDTSLTFNWSPATDGSGIDYYEIATANYEGPRFAKRWVYRVVQTVPATELNATLTGLWPLEAHNYTIRAVDTAGLASSWSPRVFGKTLAAPTLSFQYGTQTTGTIEGRANFPLEIQLRSVANPAAEYSLVSGPVGMTVDASTGSVQWTPGVEHIGLQNATFRAANSVGSADLTIPIDVLADLPQLSVQYTSGRAIAGGLFTAQIVDQSTTTSTYQLISSPTGMTLDSATGEVQWMPTGEQGGINLVTVQATNAGGTADLTFGVFVQFTGPVTEVQVTGTSLLEPTARWTAPTGEGSDLIHSYQVHGFAEWGVGRTHTTHTVDYTVPAAEDSVLMTGLISAKSYALTITPVDANGNLGAANTGTSFVSSPALPVVRWSVNGFSGGTSLPGTVIAEQPAEIVLIDQLTADPSSVVLVSGPENLTFDPSTNVAHWTPTAADVTTGYASTEVVFEATNSLGTTTVTVPIRVYFSGAVQNMVSTRYGTSTAEVNWDPPADHVTPVAQYEVTMYWRWSSRRYNRSWTIPGDSTSVTYGLSPTGAVSHTGVAIVPIDAYGNYGISTGQVAYGAATNNLAPIATDDAYGAVEDTELRVNSLDGLRVNDIDTDNTPYVNPLQVRLLSQPDHGTVTVDALGAFSYTPNANFTGTDSLTYRLYDGKFYSEAASVSIQVAPVNDAPQAFDDYYSLNQDATFTVASSSGVLANDFEIDNLVVTSSLETQPAHGSVSLNADGSFSYKPDAGFVGMDSFTYVANDGLANSRIATVNLQVVAVDRTEFFIVDADTERTFQYDVNGDPTDSFRLHQSNTGSQGTTSSSDGSAIYVINENKRVYVYDGAGSFQGYWTAVDPERVDGIATDDTDIWILDRQSDTVFRYANAASLRAGEMEATDSFTLDENNRNGQGITTDGTHLWVVNDVSGSDQVFKYDTAGNYVGRWNIDPANSGPTGITIDPTGNSDAFWIVDNLSHKVYRYDNGTSRVSGSAMADAEFSLATTNTNPQGIADPIAWAVDAAFQEVVNDKPRDDFAQWRTPSRSTQRIDRFC